MIFSISNATTFWRRYLYNPTVVTIDRDYLNRNISFPPITFCLRERLNESAAEEFLMWVFVDFLNHFPIIIVDFHSGRGFNATERANPRLQNFIKNLAQFSINNLNDLISDPKDFFPLDDYVDVKTCLSHRRTHFHIVIRPDYDEDFQQIPTQHHHLINQRCFLLDADFDRRVGFVLHIQLEDFFLSLAKVRHEKFSLNFPRFSRVVISLVLVFSFQEIWKILRGWKRWRKLTISMETRVPWLQIYPTTLT